jgi:hypothetical protein
MRLMSGMKMFLTSEVMTLLKAAPMITPTARSMTLPFRAKSLNSCSSEKAFFVGSRGKLS